MRTSSIVPPCRAGNPPHYAGTPHYAANTATMPKIAETSEVISGRVRISYTPGCLPGYCPYPTVLRNLYVMFTLTQGTGMPLSNYPVAGMGFCGPFMTMFYILSQTTMINFSGNRDGYSLIQKHLSTLRLKAETSMGNILCSYFSSRLNARY